MNALGEDDDTRTTFVGAWLRAALGSAYTLAMALPAPGMRPRIVRLAREFGYDHRVGPSPRLPRAEAGAVMGDVPIRIREPVSADGNVTLLELAILSSLAASRQPRRVFEIGTFDGRTTINLAANAAPDALVYTLDLPSSGDPALAVHADDRPFIRRSQRGTRGARITSARERERIVMLEGDSATFDYGPYRHAMDMVFVDGAHSYEYVMSDSRVALDLVCRPGLIVWHDYGEWEGVTRALNELQATNSNFGGLRHVSGTTLALLEV